MARQEQERRKYNVTPRAVASIPKYREAGPSGVPDYSALPDWALLKTTEVAFLTGMAPSTLLRRVEAGDFPAPSRNGKDRTWPLKVVKIWAESKAAEGGAE